MRCLYLSSFLAYLHQVLEQRPTYCFKRLDLITTECAWLRYVTLEVHIVFLFSRIEFSLVESIVDLWCQFRD